MGKHRKPKSRAYSNPLKNAISSKKAEQLERMEQGQKLSEEHLADLELLADIDMATFSDITSDTGITDEETIKEALDILEEERKNRDDSLIVPVVQQPKISKEQKEAEKERLKQKNIDCIGPTCVEEFDNSCDGIEVLDSQINWENREDLEAFEEAVGMLESNSFVEADNAYTDASADVSEAQAIFYALKTGTSNGKYAENSRLDDIDKIQKDIRQEAFQAVDQASPYEYGKAVINNNKLCYIQSFDMEGCLSIFNGKYWEKLEMEDLKQLAYDSLPESLKQLTKGIETLITNIANYVKREMKKRYNDGTDRFTEKDYRDIENRIVFQNCVYDVKRDKVLPHSDNKPYFYAVNCNYIKEDLPTPNYDRYKRDATDNDLQSMDMFDFMQAYLLIANRSGKCFFIMTYAKDSGKTMFGEFIEGYFEQYYVSKMDTEHLGGKFSYAGYDHALLVDCLEMPVARLSASATKALKNFTGESRIEVEAKYENQITAQVRFKVLLASNGGLYLPPGQMDEAFYRRAIVIPFVRSTPLSEIDASLPRKLEEERDAIISKSLRKFRDCYRKGGGIVFPESVLSQEIKARWTGATLLNEQFVRECIIFTANTEEAIPKKDLMLVYDEYYISNAINSLGERPMKLSKEQLIKMVSSIYPNIENAKLRRKTITSERSSPEQCIVGVQWSESALKMIEKITSELTETA